MSCCCCGSILVSHTRGGCVPGSSPFAVMTNIFVTDFNEFSETFRKNSIEASLFKVSLRILSVIRVLLVVWKHLSLTHKRLQVRIIFTARKQSCGKVMFLHLSVSHSVHLPWTHTPSPLGRHPTRQTPS